MFDVQAFGSVAPIRETVAATISGFLFDLQPYAVRDGGA